MVQRTFYFLQSLNSCDQLTARYLKSFCGMHQQEELVTRPASNVPSRPDVRHAAVLAKPQLSAEEGAFGIIQ